MKKGLLFLLLIFTYFNTFAQLDREHWFAPVLDGNLNGSNVQRIYLSTNETTPFQVRVYNNNILRTTLTVSKGNPVYWDVPRNYIFSDEYTSDHFKVSTKGLYLNGDKPYFASLRFSIQQHGEILTSKGTAGIGTEFRAVVAPITVNASVLNFTTGILATEDNTQVTVSDYGSNIRFGDGQQRPQITFTLNKGQSYIIDGTSAYSQNWTGFIGAKIVANKNISVTNGNFTGQYAGSYSNSSDILMDQGVPIDKLGKEFVLMKGNGTTSSNMEKALVVATVDGTKVFLNNSTTAAATLNAGEYFLTPNNAYINHGSNHYNMRVTTTENAYVYQLLAGDSGSSMVATGGMNYIPPLSCYLPKKIDEIGMIDQNRVYLTNSGWQNSIPTKLNIITEKAASETGGHLSVYRNGSLMNLTAANGPFPVSGNDNWVTYSIAGITGNIAVESSHAVTAGISAGNDAVGYGGYFAGFSYIPAIIKQTGECLPNVILEVTEGFDSYQWVQKVGENYIPAPGINNLYTYQPTQAGIYAVKLKQGSCDEVQTGDFKFQTCVYYTPYTYDICSTQEITPTFELSSQTVNPAAIVIDTPPTKGNISIATDGKLTYTANPNATGTDFFTYTFCGIGLIPDCETVEVTLNLNQITKNDKIILSECGTNGTAIYNLNDAQVTTETVSKTYYKSENGAQNEIASELIADPTSYSSADGFVYVRLENDFGCVDVAKIELKSKLAPTANVDLYTKAHCDDEIDGVIDGNFFVNLDDITPIVVPNSSNFTVRYYRTEILALAGNNTDALTGNYGFTENTSIWIRVDSPEDCPPAIKEIQLKTGEKLVLENEIVTTKVCDDDLDGSIDINLADYIQEFNSNTGITATYFVIDAAGNENSVSPNQNITDNRSFYYHLSLPGFCDTIGTLNLEFKQSTAPVLDSTYTVCGTSTKLIDAGSGFTSYEWDNGETGQTANLGAGSHWVKVTNSDGCIYTHNFTIVSTSAAELHIDNFNGMLCDENFDGIIEVNLASQVTPIILQNSQNYTVKYYTSQEFANDGGDNNVDEQWSYTTPIALYVRVESKDCPPVFGTINFGYGNSVPLLLDTYSDTICDDDENPLDGIKSVNLLDYKSMFTEDSAVQISFFEEENFAEANSNEISSTFEFSRTKTFFIRLSKNGLCTSIARLTLTIKTPKASDALAAINTQICPDTTITLDVGSGFDSYTWSTGEQNTPITVGIGTYWVDLVYNGCTYRQEVNVSSVDLPVIQSIEIQGTTATIHVSGGKPPYRYSLNGRDYQDSNVFTNVSYGENTAYVISDDNCAPIQQVFTVIRILNVITPNGDGKNDVLNYGDLAFKEDVKLQIFDRNGTLIFTGNAANNYSWDGKLNGRHVPTSSYWYVLEWRDAGSSFLTQNKGWILVKNRD